MSETRNVAYRAILLAAGLVVLGLLFQQLVTLMLAVLMTVIVAIPLSAGADRLERRGVPRPLGVLAGLLTGLAALALILALVIPPFVDEAEAFIDDVPAVVDDLRDQVHDVTGATTEDIGEQVQEFFQGLVDDPAQLLGRITSIGLSIAAVLAAVILMLITAFYMAVRPEPLLDGALKLFPPARRPHAQHVMGRLRTSWIGWMQGVAVDMVVTGVLLYIGLSLVGLEFAIVFAVVTALLVVVPYFGAIVGGALPVLFALTDTPGKALLVLLVYLAVQQVESNVIIPLVMSRTVRLHPAVIAVGVVLVGQIFGFVGLVVAVPILSALVILVDELWIKPTEERHETERHTAIELPREAEDSRDEPTAPARLG
ncbi:MAG: AI-2E family transporter [Thermoleophilaceae bacterium]